MPAGAAALAATPCGAPTGAPAPRPAAAGAVTRGRRPPTGAARADGVSLPVGVAVEGVVELDPLERAAGELV
eukprot:2044554-Alexandrium_andersonii.AAC.1